MLFGKRYHLQSTAPALTTGLRRRNYGLWDLADSKRARKSAAQRLPIEHSTDIRSEGMWDEIHTVF
jgi:hypothetical protein